MSFIKKFFTAHLKTVLSTAIVFAALFFVTATAHAATLSVSPGGGTVSVGKSFSVRVVVGSGGQSINAVSGSVSFSNSLLTLRSISKGSLVTLWAQDPTYSNASGTASFQGVILNGYSGGAGTVVTLNFVAKAQGTANISISSGGSSVLLNDGAGTNVLSGTSGAAFTITAPAQTSPRNTQPVSQPIVTPTPTAEVTPQNTEPSPVVATAYAKPLFTDYQSPLLPGNFVVVKGTASPNSLINITFTQTLANGRTTVSQTSLPVEDNGEFTFVSDQKVVEGSSYTLVASTADGQSTAPLSLAVKNSLWFNLTTWIASLIAIQMSVALALLLIALIAGYLLYRNRVLKKRLKAVLDELHKPQ